MTDPTRNGNGQASTLADPTASSDRAAAPNPKPNDFIASRAIRHSDLTSGAKLVLEAIADKARHGRSVCTVSYQNLARLVNLKRRWTIDLVGRLARSGWITTEARSSVARGFQANHIRMGPRFVKAVEDQARREEEERKRRALERKIVPQSLNLGQKLDPSAFQCTTLVHSDAPPSALDRTQRTPIKDSLKDSESSSSSTPPPPGRKDDDDDVRFAPKKSGGSKRKPEPLPDDEGLDMVCRVASKCARLPGAAAKFRAATDLGYRIEHDWRLLAQAVVRLDAKVAAGDAKPRNAASVAVTMLAEMRSMDFPAEELERLQADVERLLAEGTKLAAEEEKFRATVREWWTKGLAKGDSPALIESKIRSSMVQRHDSEIRFRWAQDEILKLRGAS